MPARRFVRTISGVLKELHACSAANWRGYTFKQALELMSWENFGWLVNRLARDKKRRKDTDVAYLCGAYDALNRVQVHTHYDVNGVPQWRRLKDNERCAAVRYDADWREEGRDSIANKLRVALNVR